MKCREYLHKIAENGGDMSEVTDLFCDTIMRLESERVRKETCDRLYVLAYGEKASKACVEDDVNDMTYGEKWSMKDTTQVGKQYGFNDYSEESFYWTMNMLYNDYRQVIGEDINTYVRMARAFLIDDDAPEGDVKVYRYIKAMQD